MNSSRRSRPKRRGSPRTKAQRARTGSGATQERIVVTMAGLHQLRRRIEQRQLEPEDWPLIRALVRNEVACTEGKQDHIFEWIAVDITAEEAKDPVPGASGAKPGESANGTFSSGVNAASSDDSTEPVDSNR